MVDPEGMSTFPPGTERPRGIDQQPDPADNDLEPRSRALRRVDDYIVPREL